MQVSDAVRKIDRRLKADFTMTVEHTESHIVNKRISGLGCRRIKYISAIFTTSRTAVT